MFKCVENVSRLISSLMKSWMVEMSYGREKLAEVCNSGRLVYTIAVCHSTFSINSDPKKIQEWLCLF